MRGKNMNYHSILPRKCCALESIMGASIGTAFSLLTACSTPSIERTTLQQSRPASAFETVNVSAQEEPFYTTERPARIPPARTGSRAQYPINDDTEEFSRILEAEEGHLPIVGEHSITFSDQGYHANIDVVQDEELLDVGGKYVITFYTLDQATPTGQALPRTFYRFITNYEGTALRANYQIMDLQKLLTTALASGKTLPELPLTPELLIVHQNPFGSEYGAHPHDCAIQFVQKGREWEEKHFTPRDPNNPIPYLQALELLCEEKERLYVTQDSCRRVITTAQQAIGNNTALWKYLSRR